MRTRESLASTPAMIAKTLGLIVCALGAAIYFATVAHVVEPFVGKKSAQPKLTPKKV